MGKFPTSWNLGTQRPSWIKGIAQTCRSLRSDVKRVNGEARSIRNMVSAKHMALMPVSQLPPLVLVLTLTQSSHLPPDH